jgi:hypothetical protein
MQRTQSFSCLFRHYAKHNGLCKDDLVFYFTEELQPDENPELVHLQPYDEIWVEHRKSANQRRRLRGGNDTFRVVFLFPTLFGTVPDNFLSRGCNRRHVRRGVL